ncbi:imidazole glycerol phosphate synthase subunit HisH [Zongyangia hominis]|uniref:Imidazole glycerol phosphate synthase subunit HisH n=1 Tax=Zongyangia hominis TaxID=2763677 RepID=A0A926ECZ4_9FIRM|nr:imidazole glycerol phosphate synthase subunit HisH [Zongyangia hominis]MBC8569666.1 imidazole glycerol phosphate synthase subunit HisH [Zongyangia hominis]
MIAIIDYGAGNLFSVKNALDYLGVQSEITDDPRLIAKASGVILPGVGAFPDAMGMLSGRGLKDAVHQAAREKPFLGICLGMQMLFDEGREFETVPGLGLIDGYVDKLDARGLKIPHMGWNELKFHNPCVLLEGVDEGEYVYFVHSYMAYTAEKNIAATCDYGQKVTALVQRGQVFGAQFHPEKSGETGLIMLRNFERLTK